MGYRVSVLQVESSEALLYENVNTVNVTELYSLERLGW